MKKPYLNNSYASWTSYLWPIRKDELQKFIPMAVLLSVLLLSNNILYYLNKEISIVTLMDTKNLHNTGIFSCTSTIVFLFTYFKMSNYMGTTKVFRYILSFFLGFFALFAFAIFPMREILLPNQEIITYYAEKFYIIKGLIIIL